MACRNTRAILQKASLVLALGLACAGYGPSGTPEDDIRALIDAAEAAAESRDAGDLRALVADDYADVNGRTADDIRGLLHGYLIAHQSIRLITRIDSIELDGNELARVKVTIGMLGREADSDSNWDFASDIDRLDLRVARQDGEWRVIRAERQN